MPLLEVSDVSDICQAISSIDFEPVRGQTGWRAGSETSPAGHPTDAKRMRAWNFPGRVNGAIQMKKTRFTEAQIMGVLRQSEGGIPVPELCREHGISSATFYKWRARYGGMDASMMIQSER